MIYKCESCDIEFNFKDKIWKHPVCPFNFCQSTKIVEVKPDRLEAIRERANEQGLNGDRYVENMLSHSEAILTIQGLKEYEQDVEIEPFMKILASAEAGEAARAMQGLKSEGEE